MNRHKKMKILNPKKYFASIKQCREQQGIDYWINSYFIFVFFITVYKYILFLLFSAIFFHNKYLVKYLVNNNLCSIVYELYCHVTFFWLLKWPQTRIFHSFNRFSFVFYTMIHRNVATHIFYKQFMNCNL